MTYRTRIAVATERRLEMDLLVPVLKRELSRFKVLFCVSDFNSLMKMLKVEVPDVLIADISMAHHKGEDYYSRVKGLHPSLRIVLISNFSYSLFETSYLSFGYDAILTKEADLNTLLEVIDQVDSSTMPATPEMSVNWQFTKKELEIIPRICAGHTIRGIADELRVSEKAIEKHRQKIYRKTNCRNKADFVVHAIKNDLIYICTLFDANSLLLTKNNSNLLHAPVNVREPYSR